MKLLLVATAVACAAATSGDARNATLGKPANSFTCFGTGVTHAGGLMPLQLTRPLPGQCGVCWSDQSAAFDASEDFSVTFVLNVQDPTCTTMDDGVFGFVLHNGAVGKPEQACAAPPGYTSYKRSWAVFFKTTYRGMEPYLREWDAPAPAKDAADALAAPRPAPVEGEHTVTLTYTARRTQLLVSWLSGGSDKVNSRTLRTDVRDALGCSSGRHASPCLTTAGFTGTTSSKVRT